MGHTRLGAIPKTQKWNDVVELLGGSGLSGFASSAATNVGAIAAQSLDAAQQGLKRAVEDPGVRYTFFLLTQMALAARTPDWESARKAWHPPIRRQHGLQLYGRGAVCD